VDVYLPAPTDIGNGHISLPALNDSARCWDTTRQLTS